MVKPCRSPATGQEKLFRKFPLLKKVKEEMGELGPVRVRRKSLKEIEEMRNALSKTNLNYKFFDVLGAGSSKDDYSILFVSLHIDNLPELSQTVVFIKERERNMLSSDKKIRLDAELRKVFAYATKELKAGGWKIARTVTLRLVEDLAEIISAEDMTGIRPMLDEFIDILSSKEEKFPFEDTFDMWREKYEIPENFYFDVMNLSQEDMLAAKVVMDKIFDTFEAQVVDMSDTLIDKVFEYVEKGLKKEIAENSYMEDALKFAYFHIKKSGGEYDTALPEAAVEFGFNVYTDEWDGSYKGEDYLCAKNTMLCKDSLGDLTYLKLDVVTAHSQNTEWNGFLRNFEIISKEDFQKQDLQALSKSGGVIIFASEEVLYADPDNFVVEAVRDVAAFERKDQKSQNIYIAVLSAQFKDLEKKYLEETKFGRMLHVSFEE